MMYSDIFCRVYNTLGWNYYPEAFGEQLIQWLQRKGFAPVNSLDLACGTGVLCQVLQQQGIQAAGVDLSQGMIAIARQEHPGIRFDVGNIITFQPECSYDLVTSTGDSLNHILSMQDIAALFRNTFSYLRSGGWFVFDLLNEQEISDSEPFELDFDPHLHVWFQMTRPDPLRVNLEIRAYEDGSLRFSETIQETLHDPDAICQLLRQTGFVNVTRTNRLLEDSRPSTTWYIFAQKPSAERSSAHADSAG